MVFPCRTVRRCAPPVAMLSALELHAEIIALSSRRPPHCPLESVSTSSYACIAFGRPGTPISDRDSMSRERPSIARFEATIPYQPRTNQHVPISMHKEGRNPNCQRWQKFLRSVKERRGRASSTRRCVRLGRGASFLSNPWTARCSIVLLCSRSVAICSNGVLACACMPVYASTPIVGGKKWGHATST